MNDSLNMSIKLKNDELHKKVEDTISSIKRQMSSLFEAIKLSDDKNIEDHNNLEISVSTESIANKVDILLGIIESMKIENLKNFDFVSYEKMVESSTKTNKEKGAMIMKITMIQDQFNIMNNYLLETENSKYYKYVSLYNE